MIINLLPFEAGKRWSSLKTSIFNLAFTQLHISYDWLAPDNITFLTELKHLRGLEIESTAPFDLSPLSDCESLTYLNIACRIAKTSDIDLSTLRLKRFIGKDDPKIKTIYKNNTLNRLTVSNYRSTDMSQFEMNEIEHITIDGSKDLTSLKGIERLPELKLIEIDNCPKLKRPLLYSNDYPFLRIYIDGTLCQ